MLAGASATRREQTAPARPRVPARGLSFGLIHSRGSNPTSTALTCTNAGLGGSRAAASGPCQSHLVVSVFDRRTVLQPGTSQLSCQVTEVVDMSERRGARRRSVCPLVQGCPEPSA